MQPSSQLVCDRITREQEPHQPEEPERNKAAAVLAQAVDDLKRDNRAVAIWFDHPDRGLTFWCEALGLNAEAFRWQALDVATRPEQKRKRRPR